jgi:hypothetical protein
MASTAHDLADQLQGVLDGSIRLADVLIDPGNKGELLESCLHGLQHFLSDGDIRGKDAPYRQMQEDEMRKLIWLLRNDPDRAKLAKIHFLGGSAGVGPGS